MLFRSKKITLLLNEALKAEFTLIASINDENTHATTLAMVQNNVLVDNLTYELAGTPCFELTKKTRCIIPKNVDELYPEDTMLTEMDIKGYVGVPLFDSESKVIGLIVSLFKNEISNEDEIVTLFEMFSGRISGEFERVKNEEELTSLNLKLDQKVKQRTRALEDTIEKLKKAQKTVVLNEKMASLGLLTASIAHEINNPAGYAHTALYMAKDEITKIKTFLYELAGGENADAEVMTTINAQFNKLSELIITASDGSQRIKNTINDLRLFTRNDDNTKQPVKLSELINSTVFLVSTQFDHINIKQDYSFDPVIKCFPAKLSQVFMNLISNACQAIEEKLSIDVFSGKITISSSKEGEFINITIEDNGCGMTEEVLQRIFEPFYTTKSDKGTGLGMSISQDIILEHQGKFEISSSQGEGTKISLLLPLNS